MSLQIVDILKTSGAEEESISIEDARLTKSAPTVLKLLDVVNSNDTLESSTSSIPFNPSIENPVFHGYFYYKNIDFYNRLEALEANPDFAADAERIRKSSEAVGYSDIGDEFDPSRTHPSCYGYQLLKEKIPATDSFFENIRSPKTCPAREYVETYIFPVLLPALEKMLQEAKEQQATERRRTRFNGCDYLTEYLYRNNPAYFDRGDTSLWDIPFVERILKENPRPPLPLSLLLTEDEAAEMIQAFWRGYQVRKGPDVQELRQYQRDMREEEYDINFRVSQFWKKHPVEEPEEDAIEEVAETIEGTEKREEDSSSVAVEVQESSS